MPAQMRSVQISSPIASSSIRNFILTEGRSEDAVIMRDLVAARQAIHERFAPELAQDPVYIQSTIDIGYGRYNACLAHFVPWLHRYYNHLTPQVLVEIGAGTGSSTAAFARMCGEITGYDFDESALEFARTRIERLGVRNARLVGLGPEGAIAAIRREHPDGVDGIILYAVLEHMTADERIEMISGLWSLLRQGGCFLVGETPNRLSYLDHHTTGLPFFNMLNEDLALRYYHKTTRQDVIRSIDAGLAQGKESGRLALIRTGYSGASYHEFELALGENYASYVVSTPDDPEIMGVYGDHSAEVDALKSYVASKGLNVHPCFLEAYLLFILRKPLEG